MKAGYIKALDSAHSRTRKHAAEQLSLKMYQTQDAISPLTKLLEDSDLDVITAGEKTLALLNAPPSVMTTGYIEALDSAHSRTRRHAAEQLNLKEYQTQEAVEPLIRLLKDSDVDVIKAAETTLTLLKIPTDRLKVGYRSALDSPHSRTREYAVKKLKALGDGAMVANPGGIDLNAKNMVMDVSREGNGVEMKFDPVMIAEFQRGSFSGVVANIIRIIPIKSALPIMGLDSVTS